MLNWTPPSKAKKPFNKWLVGTGNLAQKVRSLLGIRLDDDHVQTTHRRDYNTPNGTAVADAELVTHHFEQEAATADNVKFTTTGTGRTLIITVPKGSASRGDIIRVEEPDGTLVSRLQADGTWDPTP